MRELNWTLRFHGLSRLSARLRTKLEATSRVRRIKAGTRIFGLGESSHGMLFLIEGTVRVHQQGENGRDIVLYRVTGGESWRDRSEHALLTHSAPASGV